MGVIVVDIFGVTVVVDFDRLFFYILLAADTIYFVVQLGLGFALYIFVQVVPGVFVVLCGVTYELEFGVKVFFLFVYYFFSVRLNLFVI